MATIRDLTTELTDPASADKLAVSDTSAAAGSQDKWIALGSVGRGMATQITVADDAVMTLPAPLGGFIFVSARSSGAINKSYAAAYYASGSRFAESFLKGSDVDSSVIVLTGTTGTDGKITISVNNIGGSPTAYIENRSGASQIFAVTLIGV